MNDERTCAECGAPIPSDARQGLCPRCLLGLGLEAGAAGPVPEVRSAGDPSAGTLPPDEQGPSGAHQAQAGPPNKPVT